MAFEVKSKKNGKTYYLHSGKSANNSSTLYFFRRDVREGAVDHLPTNKYVVESETTGLPMLKTKVAAGKP